MTVDEVRAQKGRAKLTMCTAYDGLTARWVRAAGIALVLVARPPYSEPGGAENAARRTREVSAGAQGALVVAEVPPAKSAEAIQSAALRLMEAGAGAVAFSGEPDMAHLLVERQVPVLGRLDGSQIMSSKNQRAAGEALIERARALAAAGAFALLLELCPDSLAKAITGAADIPTLGLGSGPSCDGQVQVIEELLGFFPSAPRRAKVYARVGKVANLSLENFKRDVEEGRFPGAQQTFDVADPGIYGGLP